MPGNDSYTKLLLHMNGPNGSQVFPDDSIGNTAVDKLLAYSGVTFKSDAVILQCACEINSTSVLVVFADTNNSNYGTARYLSYDPDTEIITASADYVFLAKNVTAQLSVCRMDTNHFIILFDDVDNAHYTTAVCLKLLSGTFSHGSELVVEESRSNALMSVSSFDSTYALAAYGDAANTDSGTVRCLVRNNTTLTRGSALVFSDNDSTQHITSTNMDVTKALVSYTDSGVNDGRVVCIYRSSETSTELNKGSTAVYEDSYTPDTYTNSLLALNTTYAVIGYRGSLLLAFAKLLSLAGTTVTVHDRVAVASVSPTATVSNIIALGYFSETKLGYAYISGSVPYCIELTRDEATLTVSTAATAIAATTGIADLVTIDENNLFMTLGDASESNYAKAFRVLRNSGHVVTANGTAQVSTAYYKFAPGSALCSGGSNYLTVATSTDFEFTGDFCIDFWVYVSALNAGFALFFEGGKGCYYFNNNLYTFGKTIPWAMAVETLYHIAISRSGEDFRVFINGTQLGSTLSLTGTMTLGAFNIGSANPPNYTLNGYIDEFRISNTPRYTANFTPPTEPYSTPIYLSNMNILREYREQKQSQLNLLRDANSLYYVSEIHLERDWRGLKTSELALTREWREQHNSILGLSRSWRVLFSSTLTVSRSWNELKSSLIKLRRHLFTGTKYRLYIHNISTNSVTLLGTFDGSYELNGISVPDGSYELIVESDEGLYNNIRTVYAIGFSVGSGDVENIGLPLINNLTSERKAGFTQISWDITSTTETYIDGFYIWFDDSSPVDTSGTQDDTQPYFSGNNEYDYFYEQTEAKYIAIKPYSGATFGTIAELYLPWQTVSAGVPEYQFVPDTVD